MVRESRVWSGFQNVADGVVAQQVGFLLPARADAIYLIHGFHLTIGANGQMTASNDRLWGTVMLFAGTDTPYIVTASPVIATNSGFHPSNVRLGRVVGLVRLVRRMQTAVGAVSQQADSGWMPRHLEVPSLTVLGNMEGEGFGLDTEYTCTVEYELIKNVSAARLAAVNLQWNIDPQDRTRVVSS